MPYPAVTEAYGVIRADFRGVFPYLIAGIAIGSIIYGYLPTTLLEQYAGPANPFAIPAAAIIGVPLYIRAEAVIPLAAALLAKGVGAGTVLALIIGSAGASLTELILLRALFRFRLLAAFVLVIISMAIMAGYTAYLFSEQPVNAPTDITAVRFTGLLYFKIPLFWKYRFKEVLWILLRRQMH